jgi:hypothetical protein
MKIKLKCRNFDTTEVIEVKLQAELNILTEHNFQVIGGKPRGKETTRKTKT